MNTIKAIPVDQSNWVPVSSVYEHDKYIKLRGNYFMTADGYTFYNQNINHDSFDSAINKNTIFNVAQPQHLLDFMYDEGNPNIRVGGYLRIKVIVNSLPRFIGENNGYLRLYDDIDKALFFNVKKHSDDTISFYVSKDLLVTVSADEPLLLYLNKPLTVSQSYRQRFIYSKIGIDQITFRTLNSNRYWAYRTSNPNAYMIRANGYIKSGDTTPVNNYIFNIPDFEQYIGQQMSGLTTDHHYITYYNEIANKLNNKNVTIKDKVKIPAQHLIDNPYNKITKDGIAKVNIANMKNIMTDGYNYGNK